MNVWERRKEIINILIIRRRITVTELAEEFSVTMRTIENDIQALSRYYPFYTKQGVGGIFMLGDYNPYINSLTEKELKTLKEVYESAEERHKETLL
ncbi:MAG TPA: transcriptional regulator [Lachnospiraceae bacterium]|nr:transcriptional regulator [Lachnospiraceae bacterium]